MNAQPWPGPHSHRSGLLQKFRSCLLPVMLLAGFVIVLAIVLPGQDPQRVALGTTLFSIVLIALA